MSSKRGIALLGARAVAGLVGLGVVVASVGAATLVSWPTVEKKPSSVIVSPTPSEQQRVCPGPLLALAEDSSQAQATSSIDSAAAVSGAHPAAGESGWIDPEATGMEAPDNANAESFGAPLLLRVPTPPGSEAAPLVSGSQSQIAGSETLGGLAVAGCGEAAGDNWLVGGSTDIGRTSLVLLSNPTTVVATVDLAVFGETGPVDAPGSTGILVQPGTQRVVSLAGLAPNLRSPVVHVLSTGGQVAATLQQSIVRGLEPGGVDLVGPSSGPTEEQAIAGVVVSNAAGSDAPDEVGGLSDDVTSVRVLVPGAVAATVQVGVTGATGQAAGTSVQVDVQPGVATEVPLTGLVPGTYSLKLIASEPIVAAAQSSAAGSAGRDFAWFASSDALADEFLVAAAAGPSPQLNLVNTGSADAGYTISPENGAPSTVTVPAGGSATVPLEQSQRYLVSGGTSTVASVSYAGDGLLAAFTLNQAGPLAAPIRVYPR
ncbi:hypothetical protein E3T28_07285 [Cryobacterium sinapicolor]|uniref:Large extracellular alpha-helical protein n=1 Tax=Cryobacterium sinapicolor TaxID=1259236 RepID=A0ABY2J7G7_9MICO|nr:DUF5719 family protein [Cryobacterium sinapicolor]TFD00895.1 hypothetical protein E3T28_07285 [Cryobacterium sinapicolor]